MVYECRTPKVWSEWRLSHSQKQRRRRWPGSRLLLKPQISSLLCTEQYEHRRESAVTATAILKTSPGKPREHMKQHVHLSENIITWYWNNLGSTYWWPYDLDDVALDALVLAASWDSSPNDGWQKELRGHPFITSTRNSRFLTTLPSVHMRLTPLASVPLLADVYMPSTWHTQASLSWNSQYDYNMIVVYLKLCNLQFILFIFILRTNFHFLFCPESKFCLSKVANFFTWERDRMTSVGSNFVDVQMELTSTCVLPSLTPSVCTE